MCYTYRGKTAFNHSTEVSLCHQKEVPMVRKNWIRIATAAIIALLASGLVLVPATGAAAGSGHAPIVIRSDSDFASCACVASGTGSTTSPYIIGPLTINNVNGVAVSIDGSTLSKSFELLNLTIAGNSTSSDTGIVL